LTLLVAEMNSSLPRRIRDASASSDFTALHKTYQCVVLHRGTGVGEQRIRSPVVDEERMTPGHWLGSVLYVPFSALTLMVGWQEVH